MSRPVRSLIFAGMVYFSATQFSYEAAVKEHTALKEIQQQTEQAEAGQDLLQLKLAEHKAIVPTVPREEEVRQAPVPDQPAKPEPEAPVDPNEELAHLDEQLKAEREAKEKTEETAEAENARANQPAEYGDPPANADHAGQVAAAQLEHQSALSASNEAQQNLAGAQQAVQTALQAENQLAHAPATDSALAAAKFNTTLAQGNAWNAQNRADVAGTNLQAAQQRLTALGQPATGAQAVQSAGPTAAQGSQTGPGVQNTANTTVEVPQNTIVEAPQSTVVEAPGNTAETGRPRKPGRHPRPDQHLKPGQHLRPYQPPKPAGTRSRAGTPSRTSA